MSHPSASFPLQSPLLKIQRTLAMTRPMVSACARSKEAATLICCGKRVAPIT